MSEATKRRLLAVGLLGSALGIGAVVLQRWIAATRFDAIVYVAIWFAAVGAVAAVVSIRSRSLRRPLLGAYAAIVVVSAVAGYWWGFRDHEVHEQVVMASLDVRGAERVAALESGAQPDAGKPGVPERPRRPVSIARGSFSGADGHAGSGDAEVVRTPSGERVLTFTRFDVDPGAKVAVYLTRDPSEIDDRIELGNLKGNVGDQQYEIPDDADLGAYDTVVLYCTPFTVRIATAPLG